MLPTILAVRRRHCCHTHVWVLPMPQVLQIACGGMHTVALLEDGRIFSWGVNDEGALGRETGALSLRCCTDRGASMEPT